MNNEHPKSHSQNNRNPKECDKMPRKAETPKIKTTTVTFNGNGSLFDKFIETLMIEYLEQDSMPNIDGQSSVQKVEVSTKTA